MRAYRDNLTLDNIRAGVEESRLSDAQKELAEVRLDFAAEFIDDTGAPLASKLRPGRLVIVDLRDELVQREQALGLFGVMLNIFAAVGTHEPERFNKFVVFDEAHKYMTGGDLTEQVVSTIRQMRHQGVSVLISSQDPPSLPGTVIELSSIVMLHRFNSPSWVKHVQKSVTALSDLKAEQLTLLKPGEAYVWANKATEPVFSQKAVKIRLRPRATLHGGTTRTAGVPSLEPPHPTDEMSHPSA
jgi:DNA helicase HerA-like ATPase